MRTKHLFAAAITSTVLACGGDSDRVRVDFTMEAGAASTTVTNDFGWSIALTEAKLHAGPVQFYEGAPLMAQTPTRLQRVLAMIVDGLRPVSQAHAHPGHYVPGASLGDLLQDATIDLLSPTPFDLGSGNGVSGEWNSAEVALAPSPNLNGHSARISGRATKAGREIVFSADVDVTDLISGVAVRQSITMTGERLRMEIDLTLWVNRINFDALPGDTTSVAFLPNSQGHNAIARGVISTSAFRFVRK